MTPRSVLFWQPAGIGDIFFLQKAARHFISLGYEVIWPVIPDFLYIKDYIKGINFVNENEDFPHKEFYKTSTAINTEEFVYIPFDISHHRFGVPPMKGKYMLMQFMGFNVDEINWKDSLEFERNEEREIRCNEILNIKNEPFIFINNICDI